ncbi:MAG: DUF4349 domain-containing protein [Oscillospiraceae bacterium]|nr:DUF4349 domain-containing protein [Oscillospiraceae bacterium]
MKKNIFISALLCAAIMTGCSSANTASDSGGMAYVQHASAPQTNGASASMSDSKGFAGSYETAAETTAVSVNYDYDGGDSYEYAETPADPSMGESPDNGLEASKVSREMLVYYCTMSIDTLDFEKSVTEFKRQLDSYGGFIEQEDYSDGGGHSVWYNERAEKWQSYTATLRVPSKNYEEFCNSASELGDLRSKNARVENVSQEYSDLSTTLEIYEAKEDRYIALLSTITEDEYAVAVERELTDIQIKIANIKTRMNVIETDVAYSYVYMTINEVKEYVSEPVKTDTFFDRLSVTLKNAGSGFLDFLEGLLFLIIYLAPYLVLFGIIAYIVVSIVKKIKKRKAAKKEKAQEKQDKSEQSEQETEQSAAEPGDDLSDK